MQKFYWSNQQQASYNNDKLKCYSNHFQQQQTLYKDFAGLTLSLNDRSQPLDGRSKTRIIRDDVISVEVRNESQQVRTFQEPNNNKVILRLSEDDRASERCSPPSSNHWRQYNRTWNENIKNPFTETGGGRQRRSIQNPNIFQHDYENVYDDNDSSVKDKKCPSSSARSTPRSRKRKVQKKQQNQMRTVYRSKSCERVPTSSERRSEETWPGDVSPISSPPTPTPSLLQSVAARAIPCVEIKV